MKTNDLVKYKKSKILVKDLLDLIALLEKAQKDLKPYSKYNGISDILTRIYDTRSLMLIHLNKQKKIMESKGSTDND